MVVNLLNNIQIFILGVFWLLWLALYTSIINRRNDNSSIITSLKQISNLNLKYIKNILKCIYVIKYFILTFA